MLFVCKGLQTECAKKDLSQIGGDGPPTAVGGIDISASVGIRGRNLPDDTAAIQRGLNDVAVSQGGANPRLTVDGKCGPKTNKAIQVFQLKHFGWKGADGLVEPLRQTLAKLNELAGPGFSAKAASGASASPKPVVLPDLTKSFRLVHNLLLAVTFRLDSAAGHIERDLPLTRVSEPAVRLVNEHFALHKIGFAPARRRLFRTIRGVYARMGQVMQRPGGLWGPAAFEPDTLGDKNLAYTNFGGFFRAGQFRFLKGKRIRLDSIFISQPFTELKEDDSRALVHIHELAHFVGNPEFIDDHAYNFHEDGARMKRLRPVLRVLNAENYMNFAWGAKHGRAPRPPGV